MAEIIARRMTHQHSGELVVFILGTRINQPWRVSRWLPVVRAMPKMLAELSRDPESGLLGYTMTIGRDGPYLVQYWSSHEKLYEYASKPDAVHRPAWTAFNRAVRSSPEAIGIWHETFQVSRAESIYAGMPVSGLAKATTSVPVGSNADRARERYAAGSVGVS